jgi:CheY-like chemotaxis protein
MEPSRILVVDDSLTIRRALELILAPRGYALAFAADGRQAIEQANEFLPNLVLLDYVLPDMRGPDVCAALAATPATARTPVILVSAKGASIRQAYQDAHNVVSYITKPFKPQVVQAVVENALARTRAALPAEAAAAATYSGMTSATSPTTQAATYDATLALLLAHLEEAAEMGRASGRTESSPASSLWPALRHAAERMQDVTQHLAADAIAPYRLRSDGSFASISATLLEAHRSLCEAAVALVNGGLYGEVVPQVPAIVAACPRGHRWRDDLVSCLRGRQALLIEDELGALPHLIGLIAPAVLVVPVGADATLDTALRVALSGASPETRVIGLLEGHAEGQQDWPQIAQWCDDPELLATLLAAVPGTGVAEAGAETEIGLEIVTV